jgi:hypothetical protein
MIFIEFPSGASFVSITARSGAKRGHYAISKYAHDNRHDVRGESLQEPPRRGQADGLQIDHRLPAGLFFAPVFDCDLPVCGL